MIEKQLTIKHFLLILLTFWGCTTTSAWAEKKIFVSPKGNDRAEGTLTHPLRSIQAALEKLKRLKMKRYGLSYARVPTNSQRHLKLAVKGNIPH